MSIKNHVFKIDFMGLAPIMGFISGALVVASIALIAIKGFKYGIDFAGGTEMQLQFPQAPDIAKIRSSLEAVGLPGATVQSFGEKNEVLIRMQQPQGKDAVETNRLNQEMVTKTTQVLQKEAGLPEDGVRRVDSVGPQVGSELKTQAMLATLYSLLMILVYVGLRFDFRYAPGAVFCLFHDAIITLGIYVVLGREVNVQVLAGVLTLIGYSLNDTLVNFDFIRNNEPIYKDKGFNFVINKSVNEALVRTILTSLTTFISATCLYIFGTGAIEELAFTLMVGVVIGSYSTIYIASPMILMTDKFLKKVTG